MALGLAAQDTLAHLFGAVAAFADKPFRVGDRIKLDSIEGKVEAIGMRSTRVRTADGHLVSIPNKTVGQRHDYQHRPAFQHPHCDEHRNHSRHERGKRALQLLEEIFRSEPMTKDVVITFNRFAD